MTADGAKIWRGHRKSLVEVHRQNAKNAGFEGVLHDLGD